MEKDFLSTEEKVARRTRRNQACAELFCLTLRYLAACQQGVVPKPGFEGKLHEWVFLCGAQLETAFQGHLDIGARMDPIEPRKIKSLKERLFELVAELPEE